MKWLLLALATALAGCRPGVDSSADLESLGFEYAAWPSVTDNPYPIDPALLYRCAVLHEEDLWRKAYAERGPHTDSAIVVRVSPTGRDQFMTGESVPVGTVVIKEKHPYIEPGQPPAAVAAMVKRESGYDPTHGDWEYVYEVRRPESARSLARGRITSCIDCHRGAKKSDYLFRPYLRPAD